MTIEELLKDTRHTIRLSNHEENTWLVWCCGSWEIFKKLHNKPARQIAQTSNLQQALEALITGKEL